MGWGVLFQERMGKLQKWYEGDLRCWGWSSWETAAHGENVREEGAVPGLGGCILLTKANGLKQPPGDAGDLRCFPVADDKVKEQPELRGLHTAQPGSCEGD